MIRFAYFSQNSVNTVSGSAGAGFIRFVQRNIWRINNISMRFTIFPHFFFQRFFSARCCHSAQLIHSRNNRQRLGDYKLFWLATTTTKYHRAEVPFFVCSFARYTDFRCQYNGGATKNLQFFSSRGEWASKYSATTKKYPDFARKLDVEMQWR